jgi:WD40 repeat protein
VVTAASDGPRLWDVESGQEIGVLKGRTNIGGSSAAFSPDGRRLVTAEFGEEARLWDMESGRETVVLKVDSPVYSVAFSQNGRRVVTASMDNTARLWDADSGREIAIFKGHDYWVNSAAFSPDGRWLVTASADETARLWEVFQTTDDLIDAARKVVPRCLTRARREAAFLEPEPPAWCIEMEKWPYHTTAWKQWLADRRAGKQVEMPEQYF